MNGVIITFLNKLLYLAFFTFHIYIKKKIKFTFFLNHFFLNYFFKLFYLKLFMVFLL